MGKLQHGYRRRLLMVADAWQMATPIIMLTGVVMAYFSIDNAKKTSRKQAAIEYLNSAHENPKLTEAIKVVRELHHHPDKHINSLAYPDNQDTESADSVRYLLNHLEYLSIGIKHGIYDETTIKDARYTVVIQAYTMCKPFIEKIRELREKPTFFIELQHLVTQWKKRPIK